MQPLNKSIFTYVPHTVFTLSTTNRNITNSLLQKSYDSLTESENMLSYQSFLHVLYEMGLIESKSCDKPIIKELWSHLSPDGDDYISKVTLNNFINEILGSKPESKTQETRKKFADLVTNYLRKGIGKTRNYHKKAFSFYPKISQKSVYLAKCKNSKTGTYCNDTISSKAHKERYWSDAANRLSRL